MSILKMVNTENPKNNEFRESTTSFDEIKDEISEIYNQKVQTQENLRYK